MEWKEVMPLLEVTNTELIQFLDYIENKGLYLHKQIYDIILTKEPMCEYAMIAKILKYDKGIRNVLYKYLSAFEERYRSVLFEAYDCDEPISNPETAKIEKLNLTKKNPYTSNLYDISYSRYFSLSVLREMLYRYDLIDTKQNDDFKIITKLRNKIMHHNLLMTSFHRNIDSVIKEISKIESWVEILYKYLPKGMNHEFEKAINRCNNVGTKMNVPNLDTICLREMRNGVFIKTTT